MAKNKDKVTLKETFQVHWRAYKMIRQWNEELRAKGYATVNGRVSRQYYLEHMYGMTENKKEG